MNLANLIEFKFIFSTCIFRAKISYVEMNSIVINMIEKMDWHLPLHFFFFLGFLILLRFCSYGLFFLPSYYYLMTKGGSWAPFWECDFFGPWWAENSLE